MVRPAGSGSNVVMANPRTSETPHGQRGPARCALHYVDQNLWLPRIAVADDPAGYPIADRCPASRHLREGLPAVGAPHRVQTSRDYLTTRVVKEWLGDGSIPHSAQNWPRFRSGPVRVARIAFIVPVWRPLHDIQHEPDDFYGRRDDRGPTKCLALIAMGTAIAGKKGGSMIGAGGLVASIIVFAVGAVLDWAVAEPYQHGINVNKVGWILMIVGIAGAVVSIIVMVAGNTRRRRTVVDDGQGNVVRRVDSTY